MSPDDTSDESSDSRQPGSRTRGHTRTIATAEDFRESLRAIVTEADANGVDVRGGWAVDRSDVPREWGVEITRVSRRSTASVEDSGHLASAVVDAVADREGVDTTALPPLYDTIGHDILELIHEADAESDQRVTFEYYGYTITVSAGGSVVLDG